MAEGDPARARELRERWGWGAKRIAREMGVSRDRARDWINPERRRWLRRAQDERRSARAWERGRPRRRALIQRRALIVCLWHAGAPLEEIHLLAGMSRGHLSVEMHRMRCEGYDLPYRYAMCDGRRIPAP